MMNIPNAKLRFACLIEPIIFSAESVAAILRGDKTMTRRVMKPQPPELPGMYRDGWGVQDGSWQPNPKPYDVDDILCVKERWRLHGWDFSDCVGIQYADGVSHWCYMPEFMSDGIREWGVWLIDETNKLHDKYGMRPADNEFGEEIAIPDDRPYKSPLYMPRWASRLHLRVLDVRHERIQDITLDDIRAEGYKSLNTDEGFVAAWEKLNAKRGYSYFDNPYVWVYKFEVLNHEPET